MPRNRPCLECKKSRRKCVWLPDSKDCERCVRLGLECLKIQKDHFESADLDDDNGEDEVVECGNQELQLWTKEVAELYREISKLERTLDTLVTKNSLSAPRRSDGQRAKRAKASTTTTTEQDGPQWKLSFVDGKLRLETDIKSISELLSYGWASMRYLSPFSGLFDQESLYFEGIERSIVPRTFQAISNVFLELHAKKTEMTLSMYPLKIDPRILVDYLINEYLTSANERRPLIHVPSYLKYYRGLKDVMQDAMTMAICSTMAITMRPRTVNTIERRRHAEYFYMKAKDLLADMFDDPSRRLETVITISFMLHFIMFVMLKFHEARRLGSISYMICKDMEIEAKKTEPPPIQHAIFQRHNLFIGSIMHMLDLFIDDRFVCEVPMFDILVTLPDESPRAKEHVDVYNHILRLGNTDYVRHILQVVHDMFNDQGCAVQLEDIFWHKQRVMEWWNTVPKELRLGDDPFSIEMFGCLEEIESTKKAIFFASLHSVTMSIHCAFLRPRVSSDSGIADQVAHMVREHAKAVAIRSAELVIKALTKISQDEHVATFTLEYMMQLFNSLSILYSSCGIVISESAQADIKTCLENIRHILIPDDHNVPVTASPLVSFFRSGQKSALQAYLGYPLPGYAFLADFLRASLLHLDIHTGFAWPEAESPL